MVFFLSGLRLGSWPLGAPTSHYLKDVFHFLASQSSHLKHVTLLLIELFSRIFFALLRLFSFYYFIVNKNRDETCFSIVS